MPSTRVLRRTSAGHLLHMPSRFAGSCYAAQPGSAIWRTAAGGPGPDYAIHPWSTDARSDSGRVSAGLGGAQRVRWHHQHHRHRVLPRLRRFQLSRVRPLREGARSAHNHPAFAIRGYDHHDATAKNAWMAAPRDIRPFPVVQYSGGNLDGAHVDAILEFPGRLKQALTNWRVGPESSVDDQDVHKSFRPPRRVVSARSCISTPRPASCCVRCDIRIRRWAECRCASITRTIGRFLVSRVPFKRVTTWTDGRTVFQLDSAQVNTAVDASRFAKPKPPAPPKPLRAARDSSYRWCYITAWRRPHRAHAMRLSQTRQNGKLATPAFRVQIGAWSMKRLFQASLLLLVLPCRFNPIARAPRECVVREQRRSPSREKLHSGCGRIRIRS